MLSKTEKLSYFIEAIKNKTKVPNGSCEGLFGRFSFTDIDSNGFPKLGDSLESGKAPHFIFVMGPDALEKFPGTPLRNLLVEVLGWGPDESLEEAEKGKKLGTLILFDDVHCRHAAQPATLDGIIELMKSHPTYSTAVLERFLLHAEEFRKMAGEGCYQTRIDLFSKYWTQWDSDWCRNWRNYERRGSPPPTPLMTPERYGSINVDKLTLVDSRRLLFDMFWCNQFYGFDGFTYNSKTGDRADKEYLVPNLTLEELKAISVVLPIQ